MPFDLQFCSVDGNKDIGKLVDFLRTQDLGYPHYDDWVQRAEAELYVGYKRAVLGFSDGKIMGDVVFQAHKQLPRVREIKNVRVHPALRGRYVAAFMLRQAEVEVREDYDALLVDVRANQREVLHLFRFMGFIPIAEVPLYDSHVADVVMVKTMDARTEAGIVYNARELLLGKH